MRRVVGIDPGCSGAIVLLAGDRDLVPVEWMRAPLVRLGKSSRLDSAALARFLGHHDVQHAYIEQVHSMPGQGVASSFGFGHAAGVVEGVVAALMIPTTLVTPQAWKKRAGLIGKERALLNWTTARASAALKLASIHSYTGRQNRLYAEQSAPIAAARLRPLNGS